MAKREGPEKGGQWGELTFRLLLLKKGRRGDDYDKKHPKSPAGVSRGGGIAYHCSKSKGGPASVWEGGC